MLFRIQSGYSALQRINQDLEEKIHRNVSVRLRRGFEGVCVCVAGSFQLSTCKIEGIGERKQVMRFRDDTESFESQFEYECAAVGTTDINYGLLQLAVLPPIAA